MFLNSLISHFFFFFNDTATTEIYTLSLHDALPISLAPSTRSGKERPTSRAGPVQGRSEEHTSELQSRSDVVCRLLLEKKKNITFSRARASISRRSKSTRVQRRVLK